MTTLPELLSEATRLSIELEKTIPALTQQTRTAAEAENKYRKAKSAAYVTARTMDELKLANDRAAWGGRSNRRPAENGRANLRERR